MRRVLLNSASDNNDNDHDDDDEEDDHVGAGCIDLLSELLTVHNG